LRGKLINTTLSDELLLRFKIICRILFDERKKLNNMVASRDVEAERN
jgi:hypothetical protein